MRRSRDILASLMTVLLAAWGVPGVLPVRIDAAPRAQGSEQGVSVARDALDKYSAALQSLDAAAVKKIQPSINVDNLTKAFRSFRELKVEIGDIKVLSVDASTMRVSCRVTQTLTPKAGGKQTTAVTRVIRLRRDADTWVIEAFER